MKRFRFKIEVDAVLTADEVWEKPPPSDEQTAKAALAELTEYAREKGGIIGAANDFWDFEDHITLEVTEVTWKEAG